MAYGHSIPSSTEEGSFWHRPGRCGLMSSCLERMLGSVRAQQIRSQWNQISTEFEQFVVGVLASELWTRSELDLPTRSLVTIAGLTALGKPRGLALNIEMALNNGASRQEIRETVL